CPTSNVALGVYRRPADVPLRTLLDSGVSVALGADDPLLFGARLTDQYVRARTVHRLDDSAIADLARSSIVASCAPLATRRDLLAEIDSWLEPAVSAGGPQLAPGSHNRRAAARG